MWPEIEMFYGFPTLRASSKKRYPQEVVGCSVCGKTWVTLLKRDGKRICRECADNPELVGGDSGGA